MPSQSRAVERKKANNIWGDVQADAWPKLLPTLWLDKGRSLAFFFAVCSDEAWDAPISFVLHVAESPTSLADFPDGGDNVTAFQRYVFMDIGAVVSLDEVRVIYLCSTPPIPADDLHRGIPFQRDNVLVRRHDLWSWMLWCLKHW